MNVTKVAQLFRELADQFDPTIPAAKPVVKTARVETSSTDEPLRNFLDEEDWSFFSAIMAFGKHAGTELLDVPINYFEYLGKAGWEGRGYDTDEAIADAISVALEGKRKPKPSQPKSKKYYDEDVDEDVPF